MRLMDRRVEHIEIEVTPEMKKRYNEIMEHVYECELRSLRNFGQCDDLQGACLREATRVDNISRYGTDDFGMEGSPKTKKKGSFKFIFI